MFLLQAFYKNQINFKKNDTENYDISTKSR